MRSAGPLVVVAAVVVVVAVVVVDPTTFLNLLNFVFSSAALYNQSLFLNTSLEPSAV